MRSRVKNISVLLAVAAICNFALVGYAVCAGYETKSFAYSQNDVIRDYQIGDNADRLNYRMHKRNFGSYSPLHNENIDLRWSSAPGSCFNLGYCSNKAMNEEARQSQLFRGNKASQLDKKPYPDIDLEFSIPLY